MEQTYICPKCRGSFEMTPREASLKIIKDTAGKYRLTSEQLIGHSRFKELVLARHEAFYLLQRKGLSTPQIGRLMNRDHSTVIHGIREHINRIERAERLHES